MWSRQNWHIWYVRHTERKAGRSLDATVTTIWAHTTPLLHHVLTQRDYLESQLNIRGIFEPLQYWALTLCFSLKRLIHFSHTVAAEQLHVKEIVRSNIQLLYARRPRPALNWFLSEREASLSTDTQPCFPHLHPTQITPPSAFPLCVVHLPPHLSSFLSSSPLPPLFSSFLSSHHLLIFSFSLSGPRRYRRLTQAPAPIQYV